MFWIDIIVAADVANYQVFWFTATLVLIITPYYIAWATVWALVDKKRELVGKKGNEKHLIFRNEFRYNTFRYLFGFPPVGVLILALFDCWNVFEFIIIRPIYWCFTYVFIGSVFQEVGAMLFI